MRAVKKRYFSVSNGEEANYYRLRVKAWSWQGKAKFRAGWYPSESVDMLFGDVSEESESDYLKTRRDIKKYLNKTVKELHKTYLDTAKHPETKKEYLEKLMDARLRVLAFPVKEAPLKKSFIAEYDVARGVAISHADEKMVYIHSSDPDEVIGKIANFTENDKTVRTIENLSSVLGAQRDSQLKSQKAIIGKTDTIIKVQITNTIMAFEGADTDKMDEQIQILLNHLKD